MGQPLFNNYTLFRALSEPFRINGNVGHHGLNELKFERENLLRALGRFNLFAFILHDPESHPEFDVYLNHVFSELDIMTGERLLFFALVNPGREWLERREQLPFHQQVRRFEQTASQLNIEPLFTSDPSASAFALAWALGIPADDLPVLIVTTNMQDRNYLCASTSVHKLKDQLNSLSYISRQSRMENVELSNELMMIQGFEDIRDYQQTLDIPYLDSSLADTLSSVLSFVYCAEKTNDWEYRSARLQVEKVLNDLQRKMNSRKRELEESEVTLKEVENIGVQIGNLISILSKRHYEEDTMLGIHKNLLEKDSWRMLTTAMNVRDYLNRNEGIVSHEMTSGDFSPAAICFAKFFEREVNLSFVHWIRKYLGVHLPRYFDRYEPNLNATYLPDNMGYQDPNPVNFNQGNYNNWRPPSLGQSRICVDSISRKEVFETNFHYARINVVREFVRQWRELKEIRNSAAHPRILSQADLERMVSILSEMNHAQIFTSMHEMKSRFRN